MPLLNVTDLSVRYGAVRAVTDASLTIDEGELVVVIGANGAGKTSLLKALVGLNKSRGNIFLNGTSLGTLRAEQRVRQGLVLVPEGRHIFGKMSVLENLQVSTWGSKEKLSNHLSSIFEMFPRLEERQHQTAATLSGGEQQMLALSRALVRKPKLLMLDEPSMGLAPKIVAQMFEIIQEVHRAGTSVLLIEQNAKMALSIADRSYLMETGTLSGGGKAAEMLNDDRLHEAYFGKAPQSDD